MIFYTSDLHFGYENIIHQARRPFAGPEEMDEALIRNWNDAVGDEDTVYFIGDIGGHSSPFPGRALSRLRGHKHLIRGNHDTGLPNQQRLFEFFETVTDFLEVDDGGDHITLCHYPLVYIQGGYMIHGHIHNAQGELFEMLKALPRVMNAGVDINNFRPVTLAELIANNQIFYGDPLRGTEPNRYGETPYRRKKWPAVFLPLPVKGGYDD